MGGWVEMLSLELVNGRAAFPPHPGPLPLRGGICIYTSREMPCNQGFAPSPPDAGRRRGLGRGGAFFEEFPSPWPSPHSFLAGRGDLCRYKWLKPGVNEKSRFAVCKKLRNGFKPGSLNLGHQIAVRSQTLYRAGHSHREQRPRQHAQVYEKRIGHG